MRGGSRAERKNNEKNDWRAKLKGKERRGGGVSNCGEREGRERICRIRWDEGQHPLSSAHHSFVISFAEAVGQSMYSYITSEEKHFLN